MLGRRRRRWPNSILTLSQLFLFLLAGEMLPSKIVIWVPRFKYFILSLQNIILHVLGLLHVYFWIVLLTESFC